MNIMSSCLKILIYSRAFWPSIGGVETMMEILAEEFTAAGHQVKVVTQVASQAERNQDYEVVRQPTLKPCVQLLRWSDVCLCANVSLRGLMPMMIARTRLVVSHQGSYDPVGDFDILSKFKKIVTQFSNNISCSQAVQSRIPGRSVVIPNSYRSEIFKEYSDVTKDLDIVFVGRLDSDKGAIDLIDALGLLSRAGFRARLSIVGDGPERSAIFRRVEELGLREQVAFTGTKVGSELARFVARHRVMAVPSLWEPFGIVALEGIACGCAVVGTALGGLPEAIGPCGLTVPNADSRAMARALKSLLEDDGLRANCRSGAPVHLARHSRAGVARSYLKVLESAVSLSS
jgi:glycosyltransferase involved in cell wall biosynthesis